VKPLATDVADGNLAFRAEFHGFDSGSKAIEIILPKSAIPVLPVTSDHFAFTALFPAMLEFDACHIEGTVSREFLENISELNAIWHVWKPKLYRQVQWSANEVIHNPPIMAERSGYIMTYSGGVDASVTLRRHTTGKIGWRQRAIKRALLVHGFDIATKDVAGFKRATERAERITAASGVPLTTVFTNLRELPGDWSDSHGANLACILHLFNGSFEGGVIASDETYANLVLPWGSNPVSNPLFGTRYFPIRTDGAELTRLEKVKMISEWPVAANNVRVCWEGNIPGDNCGVCLKCVLTQLEFLACGATINGNFQTPLQPGRILDIHIRNPVQLSFLAEVLEQCDKNKISTWWTEELRVINQRARDTNYTSGNKKSQGVKKLLRKIFNRR